MNFNRKKAERARISFTLIELLVVIAIIAILASLLLPALKKAKSTAQDTACKGNLKSIASAIMMYVGDKNSYMPVSTLPNGVPMQWKMEIAPYLGFEENLTEAQYGVKIFKCPCFDERVYHTGGYGWNPGYGGCPGGNFGIKEDPAAGRPRVRLESTQMPSETIVCGDTTDWYDAANKFQMAYLYEPWMNGAAGWPNPVVGNRHGGGVNSVWADSHVERKSQFELLAGKNTKVDWYLLRLKLW